MLADLSEKRFALRTLAASALLIALFLPLFLPSSYFFGRGWIYPSPTYDNRTVGGAESDTVKPPPVKIETPGE